jgi:hypothetical protein
MYLQVSESYTLQYCCLIVILRSERNAPWLSAMREVKKRNENMMQINLGDWTKSWCLSCNKNQKKKTMPHCKPGNRIMSTLIYKKTITKSQIIFVGLCTVGRLQHERKHLRIFIPTNLLL